MHAGHFAAVSLGNVLYPKTLDSLALVRSGNAEHATLMCAGGRTSRTRVSRTRCALTRRARPGAGRCKMYVSPAQPMVVRAPASRLACPRVADFRLQLPAIARCQLLHCMVFLAVEYVHVRADT